MMFRFVHTDRFKQGKDREALQLAKDMVDYGVRKWGSLGFKASVMTEMYRDPNTLHYYIDAEDIEALHSLFAAMNADDGWQELVARGADVWLDGRAHQTLMQSL